METSPGSFAPVIIGQDEQSELHVQVLVQSGRRQLDIRIWRRGPSGFAPSRTALTLELADLDALRAGIEDLLAASTQGQEAARLVWDKDDERRLRGEIEPFGTRFVARFGFWHRVRDTWRPVDDGLVVAADQLDRLLEVIDLCRPRLLAPTVAPIDDSRAGLPPEAHHRWPNPGADWLTIEPDRLAFHPRGTRITATVDETNGVHHLAVQQWRRQESLWLPEEHNLILDVPEVNDLLSQLHALSIDQTGQQPPAPINPTEDGCIQIHTEEDDQQILRIERLPAERANGWLRLPLGEAPRFGRMLTQAGMLLIAHLSDSERADLETREGPEIAPEIVSDALPLPFDDTDEPAANLEADIGSSGRTGSSRRTGSSSMDNSADDARPGPLPNEAGGVDHEATEPIRRLTPLGELQLGRFAVFLYLEEEHQRCLALQWDGYALLAPLESLDGMLSDLRDLYYDALRGRRGQVRVVDTDMPLSMSMHNQGSAIYVVLEQEADGKQSRLQFPVGQVPAFLDAIQSAANKLG